MTLNEYQLVAYRSYMGRKLPKEEQIINNCLGLVGETGEIVDQVKKELYLNRDIPESEIVEELGDALWHLAVLARVRNLSLERIAESNIEKLQRRYPNAEW